MSSGQQQQQRFAAAAAAASLVRTLNNPYNVPAYPQPVNPQGYAYSSTYNHTSVVSSSTSRNVHPPRRAPPAHWYTPGSSRCMHPGCAFTGSHNSLEVHMMDRHLIYPPGWHARKRQSDWDADPSLKGRPVPIMGTSITLNTPEEVEAWIAERKRHWPTAARVAEKKRKLEEAIAGGGLLPDHLMKRPRLPFNADATRAGGRGRGRGRGGRGGGRPWQRTRFYPCCPARAQPPTPLLTVAAKTAAQQCVPTTTESASGSDSDAPEVLSAKRPPGIEAYESSSSDVDARPADSSRRAPPPQPKKPPRNPFAARTSLLRSLLLPEIRMTVSNLSQAIHFLVDNDFLENVELVPGQANEKRIEVVSEQLAHPESGSSVVEST
ncbi:nuclear fragile X mental retardation-interacting protein 1-domain-containing protein [Lactarius indigo]|nr:nuclear fragile X mental retardation-interacting protein 1-domain-containing protein [Lactarius indigo]